MFGAHVYCGEELVGTVYEMNWSEDQFIVDVPGAHVVSVLIKLPMSTLKNSYRRGDELFVELTISKEALVHNYDLVPRPGTKREELS